MWHAMSRHQYFSLRLPFHWREWPRSLAIVSVVCSNGLFPKCCSGYIATFKSHTFCITGGLKDLRFMPCCPSWRRRSMLGRTTTLPICIRSILPSLQSVRPTSQSAVSVVMKECIILTYEGEMNVVAFPWPLVQCSGE